MATATKRPPKKAAKKKPAASATNGAPAVKERKDVPIERIVPSPFQQRKEFPKAKVAELAESIRSLGLLQPVIVRAKPGFRTKLAKADWELIAGECRWRACQSLGHQEIRVEVWDVDDRTCREMVAAENLKRNDLNAIEEARTFRQAINAGDAPGPTELAKLYDVSQAHVSNRIRLLGLPEKVQAKIISREIPPTHARHLAPLKDHPKILDKVLAELETERKAAKQWGDGTLTVNEVRDVVDSVVYSEAKPLKANPWSAKLQRKLPALKLSDSDRAALQIITIPADNGRKALELVTNVDLLNKLRDEQERKATERAEKREAKGQKLAAKGKTNGEPQKMTPAQQKQADEAARWRVQQQAAQFRRRLWAWYVDWLRWLVARKLRQVQGTTADRYGEDQCMLVLLLRAGKWYHHHVDAEQYLVDAARAAKSPIGKNAAKDLVTTVGEDKLFGVAREFAARLFHEPHRPSPVVPDSDVGEIARFLAIDIEEIWSKEQAGPVYSEAYWRLHTIDQLAALAKELKVKVAGTKKSDYVETFMSLLPASDTGKPAAPPIPKEITKIKRPRGV